jgi:hypothetical protein
MTQMFYDIRCMDLFWSMLGSRSYSVRERSELVDLTLCELYDHTQGNRVLPKHMDSFHRRDADCQDGQLLGDESNQTSA